VSAHIAGLRKALVERPIRAHHSFSMGSTAEC
jgi:hypothetical protein